LKIYLVRHGRTPANIKNQYNGVSNDESLSQEGTEDLKRKKSLYHDMKFDYVYASPMKRVVETVAILFDNPKINELRDDLKEMDFGLWSGKNINENVKELAAKGYTWDDFVDPEGGESYAHLFDRTKAFMDEIQAKHQQDETILVASHGMVIAALVYNDYLNDVNFYSLPPENGLGYIIDTKTKEVTKLK